VTNNSLGGCRLCNKRIWLRVRLVWLRPAAVTTKCLHHQQKCLVEASNKSASTRAKTTLQAIYSALLSATQRIPLILAMRFAFTYSFDSTMSGKVECSRIPTAHALGAATFSHCLLQWIDVDWRRSAYKRCASLAISNGEVTHGFFHSKAVSWYFFNLAADKLQMNVDQLQKVKKSDFAQMFVIFVMRNVPVE